MQSEEQFDQLMMQYEQLKNGATDIAGMIDREDYDSAITLIKSRESVFVNCKIIQKYLELTPVQQKKVDKIIDELRELELSNIKKLEKGMENIQLELSKTQKSQKLQNAYGNPGLDSNGRFLNIQD